MAEQVLREHADGLKELAELLLSREVVFTEDVERIFGKRKKDIERERKEAEAKAKAGGGTPAGRNPEPGRRLPRSPILRPNPAAPNRPNRLPSPRPSPHRKPSKPPLKPYTLRRNR